MNNLVQKVSEYMQEYHMVEEGQKIVVGVSGGADSRDCLRCCPSWLNIFIYPLLLCM